MNSYFTWEQEYERRIDRDYQEKQRPRDRIPESLSRAYQTETGAQGISVRDNGRFHNQTGIPFIGLDFTIGG